MAEQEPTPADALSEMQDILRRAASEASSQRFAAIRYTTCRDVLLRSHLRHALPGFMLQCLTFARFQDFIHLYDPRVDRRLAFIDAEFQACTGRVRSKPSFDVFDDPDF